MIADNSGIQDEKRQRLTNVEALAVIQESVEKSQQHRLFSEKNITLQAELFDYLREQPQYKMKSAQVSKLKKMLVALSLTQMEVMQVINTLPIKEVDLELVIENSEVKLGGENGVQQVLALTKSIRDEFLAANPITN